MDTEKIIEIIKDYIAVNEAKMSQMFFCKKHNVDYREFTKISYILTANFEAELEQLQAENERLKTMLIEERLPHFCTGVKCGCIERVGEARKKARIKLRQELEQALKGV